MRIVAFSDSHGKIGGMLDVIEKQPSADWYVFLGDGQEEFEELKTIYPQKTFVGVRGNCDFFSQLPEQYVIDADGVKVLCAHGHNHFVKSGMGYIIESAKQIGACVILHGHTHNAITHYEDGIHLICPGSLSRPVKSHPSFAIIDITEKGIISNIVWIN